MRSISTLALAGVLWLAVASANLAPTSSCCDPHGLRGYIRASIEQLQTFLQPGGTITNFCNGVCDAAEPLEIPFGDATPCDPLACPGS